MNQAKMDEYKEFKKNRKEILEKEKKQKKQQKLVGRLIGAVLALALVAALAITGVNFVKQKQAAKPNYERTEAVIDDVAGILAEEATEAETSEDVTVTTEAAK